MRVEFFVDSLLFFERAFSGYSGFPLSSKSTFLNSNSSLEGVKRNQYIGATLTKVVRRGGLLVSALDSGSSGPGSRPSRGHCVVFIGKTLGYRRI